jgi:hypothetical protein
MHKEQRQQHLKSNNIISKLAVIVLSILLLTGISLVPALQSSAYGQSQQVPQQQNKTDTDDSTGDPLSLSSILIAIATGSGAAALITLLGNYKIRQRQEYTDILKSKIDIISKSKSDYIQLGTYYYSISSTFRNLQLKKAIEKLDAEDKKLKLVQYANNNLCLSIEECNKNIEYFASIITKGDMTLDKLEKQCEIDSKLSFYNICNVLFLERKIFQEIGGIQLYNRDAEDIITRCGDELIIELENRLDIKYRYSCLILS